MGITRDNNKNRDALVVVRFFVLFFVVARLCGIRLAQWVATAGTWDFCMRSRKLANIQVFNSFLFE